MTPGKIFNVLDFICYTSLDREMTSHRIVQMVVKLLLACSISRPLFSLPKLTPDCVVQNKTILVNRHADVCSSGVRLIRGQM